MNNQKVIYHTLLLPSVVKECLKHEEGESEILKAITMSSQKGSDLIIFCLEDIHISKIIEITKGKDFNNQNYIFTFSGCFQLKPDGAPSYIPNNLISTSTELRDTIDAIERHLEGGELTIINNDKYRTNGIVLAYSEFLTPEQIRADLRHFKLHSIDEGSTAIMIETEEINYFINKEDDVRISPVGSMDILVQIAMLSGGLGLTISNTLIINCHSSQKISESYDSFIIKSMSEYYLDLGEDFNLSLKTINSNKITEALSDQIFAPRIFSGQNVHFLFDNLTSKKENYLKKALWKASKNAKSNLDICFQELSLFCGESFKQYQNKKDLSEDIIFDKFSGAVCFLPGEWQFSINDRSSQNPIIVILHKFFNEQFDWNYAFPEYPNLKRALYTDTKVILRGDIYYSSMKIIPPWEKIRELCEETKTIMDTFSQLQSQSNNFENLKSLDLQKNLVEFKLFLAFLDQIRNIALITISLCKHQYFNNEDIIQNNNEAYIVENCTGLIELYYSFLMTMFSDTHCWRSSLPKYHKAISLVHNYLYRKHGHINDSIKSEAEKGRRYSPSEKVIRGWREADHPFENILLAISICKSNPDLDNASVLGIFWGGVELPIVVNFYYQFTSKKAAKYIGFVPFGRYTTGTTVSGDIVCDLMSGAWQNLSDIRNFSYKKVILLDDNALTGLTLQHVRDGLLLAGTEEVITGVTRFSGERREGQFFMRKGEAEKGVIMPNYLTKFMLGYIGETPYARSYSNRSYLSPTGVFNLARSRILRCLHNNRSTILFEKEGF